MSCRLGLLGATEKKELGWGGWEGAGVGGTTGGARALGTGCGLCISELVPGVARPPQEKQPTAPREGSLRRGLLGEGRTRGEWRAAPWTVPTARWPGHGEGLGRSLHPLGAQDSLGHILILRPVIPDVRGSCDPADDEGNPSADEVKPVRAEGLLGA